MTRKAIVVALTVVLFAGCAREERPAPPPYARGAPMRPAPGPAVSSADYVAQASSIELFLIGASELAFQKSSSARTREFAQVEIPAPAAGVISNILIAVGDDVKTGAPTLVLDLK